MTALRPGAAASRGPAAPGLNMTESLGYPGKSGESVLIPQSFERVGACP